VKKTIKNIIIIAVIIMGIIFAYNYIQSTTGFGKYRVWENKTEIPIPPPMFK
jgi:predicted negative regulator of RcsB-dependent stress response